MDLKQIYFHLRSDIQKIENSLEQSVYSSNPILTEASVHLLKAGGKRIRPVFVLLAGKYGTYSMNRLLSVAVPLELIHMASLVHDDVIDDADLRRGSKTIKAKYDNKVAMYCGDYIFARALEQIIKIEDKEAHEVLSKGIVQMCLGEIEQIRDHNDVNVSLKTYLRRIKRKTSLLIAISCKLGAIATGAPRKVYQGLYRYGYYVGMAFQISDDILDFTGTEEQLGKPAGGDLRQGNITLPAIYALENNEHFRDLMNDIKLGNRSTDAYNEAIDLVKSSGGIDYARQMSETYLQKAYNELDKLPNIAATKSLRQIATYIGTRKY
ncbi:heptaprenyl diphosphate synthase component II [Lottiidibacillus patelloidae]|uniref:Heptaprenyl diphosphate synthase component 2 n=1 Tax=Lottiidibacillus patelloidae TaxID=2670334 RepID=A0A263BU64_9BACI|nr:heptaprenyl diphosphate synthase component II [Lottiidibacillus patelloidae]OZM57274.1 heptaprenyl diphosphate synthase component II [Lottiidibacillus patelloidae]